MIKRILVGLGGTPLSAIATQRAIELASAHGARLTGITVVDPDRLANVGPVPIGAGDAAKRMREQRAQVTREKVEEALASFEQACRDAGAEYAVGRESGDPFDLFISAIRYHDLALVGLKGLFDYGVLPEPKDVLVRLVRRGARPIWAVAEAYRPIRKVFIAYSGSIESATAMKRFTQFRLWPGFDVRVACFDMEPDEAGELLRDAKEYLQAHGLDPETSQYEEKPARGVLARAAEWDADVIVLGDGSRSVMGRMVLGDTMAEVVRHADRPVFFAH